MSAANILCLKSPMGARLIRILYCIAIVLIAFGTVQGIIGGVRTMLRPAPPASVAMAAPAAPAMKASPPAPAAAPTQVRPNFAPGRRFGGGFRGRGPMMRGPRMFGGMMLSLPLLGGLQILFALLRGLIVLMVVRVLAEIGTAILTMGNKANS